MTQLIEKTMENALFKAPLKTSRERPIHEFGRLLTQTMHFI